MKKIDVANYFLILIVVNILFHFLVPIKQIIIFPFTYFGIFLFLLGWIPNFWVGIYFRKIGTPISSKGIPKELVTSGFFKFSRNPVYLGMVIALIGEAIFLGSLVSFIIPILFFVFVH